MTTIAASLDADLLTYDAHVAEPQVEGHYDSINGVRVFMPGVTWEHQTITDNLVEPFRRFARRGGAAKAMSALFDVMIRHTPRLQTRQPDVLLISQVRLAQGGGIPKIGSLAVAPELIVEIVSSSETQRVLADKLADYAAIGVEEVWVVRPETRTVEALRPTPDSPRHLAEHHEGKTVASSTFPTLAVSVADVFAE